MSNAVIKMTGAGSAKADPEYAVVHAQARADSAEETSAMEACAEVSNRAAEAVEAIVGVRHVYRPSVNVHRLTERNPQTGELRLAGWQASQVLNVHVDVSAASAAVRSLTELGVQVNHVGWHLGGEAVARLESEARLAAVNGARAKAAEYATLCGCELGAIASITDRDEPVLGAARMASMSAAGSGDVQLAPEPIEIHEQVIITWSLHSPE